MAILNILQFPEPSLAQPSLKVEVIDEEIKCLIADMGETMFHDSGVGLAAPQVGVNQRIIVFDSRALDPEDEDSEDENPDPQFTALINPEIIETQGSFISENEGCLSVSDYRADVPRYEQVTVRALDIDGNPVEIQAEALLSVIMQHEIDHLDGILFIDRISSLKRAMYKKRILKALKTEQ